ncbi:IPIL1 protein, partial [Ardeotis kori]|nr:IPIL1 protein [Ardeotis kori]
AWSIHKNIITYRLLVFLQPPPGHCFSLELDTTGQLPVRHFRVRVGLECMCWDEQQLGDTLCFLHHRNNKLPRDQYSHLLCTLCTCCYLDMEKIASWVQQLVRSAWLLLPQSHHCQLTLLPSSKSCRFLLTSTSKMNICTDITFAVQQ